MAYKILDSCTNCDICEPECPNVAIAMGDSVYQIDPDLCTECVGHYDEPQCVKCCPIDCVKRDPNFSESENDLLDKFLHIQSLR